MAPRKDGAPRKQRSDGLTPALCAKFLEGLVSTCHVGRSARLAGKKDPTSFYRLRHRDAEFAAQWDEAIGTARARIEAGLMARALASIETGEWASGAEGAEGADALPPLDFDKVMQLLKYYRTAPPGGVKHGPKRRYASPEETDAALMTRLDGLEARVKARERKRRAEARARREAKKKGVALGEA